jgi:hypothetical protein
MWCIVASEKTGFSRRLQIDLFLCLVCELEIFSFVPNIVHRDKPIVTIFIIKIRERATSNTITLIENSLANTNFTVYNYSILFRIG